MKAAVFNAPHQIKIIDYPVSRLETDQLLIKVAACGVCGTDFHIFEGKAPSKPPVVLGHEYVGEIVEVGKEVSGFSIGDHVAVNPNIHCGYCQFCKSGKINLCINLKALGVTMNGGFSEYSIIPLSQAYLLPINFPLDQAAYAEPLSCCVHGIERTDIKLNDTVAVVGTGTIGLLMIQLARLKGASKILAIDISNEKLMLAKNFDADEVFNSNDENFLKHFLEIIPGGADKVIECAGNENAVKTSLEIIKKGGTLTIFGLASADSFIRLNLQSFFHKELTVRSSLLNPFTFQTAVDLLVSSRVKVDLFNTSRMTLNESDIINTFSGSKDSSVIKYMIFPNN